VVGASSGLGRALAERLAADGWELGLAARREERLRELKARLSTRCVVTPIDVSRPEEARSRFDTLVSELGGVDLVILSSGVSHPKASWEQERETVEVNVLGFTALARRTMDHFQARGAGHLVGISSISALRGVGVGEAYSASKAYVSRYLEALRVRADVRGLDIAVTDVKPGYVATPMTEGRREGMFWIASLDDAADQIHDAIRARRRHAYITRRWRLVAWLLKLLPYPLLARLAGAGRKRA
jgi:short-subunit dehydrogenase